VHATGSRRVRMRASMRLGAGRRKYSLCFRKDEDPHLQATRFDVDCLDPEIAPGEWAPHGFPAGLAPIGEAETGNEMIADAGRSARLDIRSLNPDLGVRKKNEVLAVDW